MRLLLVGDLHLRLTNPSSRKDDFPETQYQKMVEVFAAAKERKVTAILCPGDVMDVPSPSYSLLSKYAPLFKQWADSGGLFITTPGNHDLYGANPATLPRTALGALAATGCVQIVGHEPYVISDNFGSPVSIFGTSYMVPETERPTPYLSSGLDYINILLSHEMVLEEKMYREQEDFEFATDYLSSNQGWDVILCGHYHYRFLVQHEGRFICNPGSLVRVKASKGDLALRPGYFIYHTKTSDKEPKIELCELKSALPVEDVFSLRLKVENDTHSMIDDFVHSLANDTECIGESLSELVIRKLEESDCTDRVARIVKDMIGKAEVEIDAH